MLSNLANSSNYDIMMAVEDMRNNRMSYVFDDLKHLQTEVINRRLETKYISYLTELMCDMLESGKMEKKVGSAENTDVASPPANAQSAPQFAPAPIMAGTAGNASAFVRTPNVSAQTPAAPSFADSPPYISAEHGRPDFLERSANMRKVMPVPRAALLPHSQSEEASDVYVNFPMLNFLQMFYKVVAWLSAIGVVGAFVCFSAFYTKGDMQLVLYGLAAAVFLSAVFIIFFYALSESLRWKLEVIASLKKKR